jgi:hypothetical protein
MSLAAAQPESASLRTVLTIATVIGGLLLMLAVWPLSMTPLIFDSGESPTTWGVFLAIWAMPVVLLAGLIIGWVGFARNRRSIVIVGLIVAMLPVLAAAGILMMSGF